MSRMTEEEEALDKLEELGKLPDIEASQPRGCDKIRRAVPELIQLFQEYLNESGLESDDFIVGQDVTFKAATELLNDIALYVNGGIETSTKVINPTQDQKEGEG